MKHGKIYNAGVTTKRMTTGLSKAKLDVIHIFPGAFDGCGGAGRWRTDAGLTRGAGGDQLVE